METSSQIKFFDGCGAYERPSTLPDTNFEITLANTAHPMLIPLRPGVPHTVSVNGTIVGVRDESIEESGQYSTYVPLDEVCARLKQLISPTVKKASRPCMEAEKIWKDRKTKSIFDGHTAGVAVLQLAAQSSRFVRNELPELRESPNVHRPNCPWLREKGRKCTCHMPGCKKGACECARSDPFHEAVKSVAMLGEVTRFMSKREEENQCTM